MYEAPYELGSAEDGYPVRIRARGRLVLTTPMLNRGTAFTPEQRRMLGLQGLLPSGVSTLEGQLRRVYAQYLRQPRTSIWPICVTVTRCCFTGSCLTT